MGELCMVCVNIQSKAEYEPGMAFKQAMHNSLN